MTSKKHGKKCENRGFGPPKTLPKSSQNASENDVPTDMGFFIDFCPILDACRKGRPLIFAGRAIVLLAFYTIQGFAFYIHFRSEKPTENPSKMKPEPLKIDAENVLFFNIDFLRFRPRFWSLLGLQDGAKLAQNGSADDEVA